MFCSGPTPPPPAQGSRRPRRRSSGIFEDLQRLVAGLGESSSSASTSFRGHAHVRTSSSSTSYDGICHRRVLCELQFNSGGILPGSNNIPKAEATNFHWIHQAQVQCSDSRSHRMRAASQPPCATSEEVRGLEARVAAAAAAKRMRADPFAVVNGIDASNKLLPRQDELGMKRSSASFTPPAKRRRQTVGAPSTPRALQLHPYQQHQAIPLHQSALPPPLAAGTPPPQASLPFSGAVCSLPRSAALSRFSTGGSLGMAQPEIRAGWFKSPVEMVSMEQLSRAHDEERFFVLSLEHAAFWKECHVEFCSSFFGDDVQVNILSGSAVAGGHLHSSSRRSVQLYFPGFQALSMKLLFRRAGAVCHTKFAQDPAHTCSHHALVQPVPSSLPIGFAVHLRPRRDEELGGGERLARDYFVNTLQPTLIRTSDNASAAAIESLLCSMRPGELKNVETHLPAVFDGRPGSVIASIRLLGTARSASAPRIVELMQAPQGQAVQVKQILVKSGDNPHQDRFALAMARVFNDVWQREGVAITVAGQSELVQNVLYGVLQASVRTSVIEVVCGSTPVKSFHDRHSKLMLAMFGDAWWQGDLNDWVPSGSLLASAAAAFTTAYVLDIGDRHQDNMLVTRDGRLFNIDFGYIFGEHPRFVDTQPFAIPVAFRTALVQNGPLWGMFKAACVKAFAALVKHREFVILQAIEVSRSLGSHFLITRALTFGKRLADPAMKVARSGCHAYHSCLNTLDLFADVPLDHYVEAVGHDLSRNIDRGVYGHQAKDAIHERRCVVM